MITGDRLAQHDQNGAENTKAVASATTVGDRAHNRLGDDRRHPVHGLPQPDTEPWRCGHSPAVGARAASRRGTDDRSLVEIETLPNLSLSA